MTMTRVSCAQVLGFNTLHSRYRRKGHQEITEQFSQSATQAEISQTQLHHPIACGRSHGKLWYLSCQHNRKGFCCPAVTTMPASQPAKHDLCDVGVWPAKNGCFAISPSGYANQWHACTIVRTKLQMTCRHTQPRNTSVAQNLHRDAIDGGNHFPLPYVEP